MEILQGEAAELPPGAAVCAPEAAGPLLQQALHGGYGGGDLSASIARVFQVRWSRLEKDGSWVDHPDLRTQSGLP